MIHSLGSLDQFGQQMKIVLAVWQIKFILAQLELMDLVLIRQHHLVAVKTAALELSWALKAF